MIGVYNAGERIFMSRRSSAKHKMVGRNEWGIDKAKLEQLIEANARVRIIDVDTGAEYWAPAEKIKREGRLGGYGPHGKQYFMELEKWDRRCR